MVLHLCGEVDVSLKGILILCCFFIFKNYVLSAFLGNIKQAYDNNPKLDNLLLDPFFTNEVQKCQVKKKNLLFFQHLNIMRATL